MITKRKLCKICDCKNLCEYIAECAHAEWFDCEDIQTKVLEIIEKNLPDEEEE